ncbi:hypothetical protein CN128_22720 [Sinorhizobium meliloti]|nr:hypothetical protein C7U62_24125 [Mesorhizobium loti]PTD25546.1 hypothetical protein C5N13_22820 [Sinorhizobium meliloti]PST27731.1 hypothetical protein C7U62_07750 [Mesorhizobium loti]RMI09990.1 hypothetical protein DA101_000895 [Sinorhizobium meliloti]RVE77615.1 hypothetical protein CN240_29370 [Sinorhizobium meliloti]
MIIRDPRQHPILCRRGTPGMHANAPEQVDAAIKAAKKPAVGEWAASPVAIAGLSRTRKRISRISQHFGVRKNQKCQPRRIAYGTGMDRWPSGLRLWS